MKNNFMKPSIHISKFDLERIVTTSAVRVEEFKTSFAEEKSINANNIQVKSGMDFTF